MSQKLVINDVRISLSFGSAYNFFDMLCVLFCYLVTPLGCWHSNDNKACNPPCTSVVSGLKFSTHIDTPLSKYKFVIRELSVDR